MRTIPSAIRTALDSGSVKFARLMKITAKSGTVYAWTYHDMQLTVDSVTYIPAPGLSALRFISTPDASVSTQQMQAAVVDVPDEDLRAGVLDEAEVVCSWCLWDNPAGGKVDIFTGRIGNIKWTQDGMQVEFVSSMKNLERNLGETFTAPCRHQLFGGATPGKVGYCGVSAAAYTFAGVVGTVTSRWKFTYTGAAAAQADGYFDSGTLTFTSGANSGVSCVVKTDASDTITLLLPAGRVITAGDTFSVKAGCDKTMDTCKNKFSNVPNFGGFPHINTDVNTR